MRLHIVSVISASALALAACGGNKATNNSAAANASANATAPADVNMTSGNMSGAGAGAVSAWPEGSRIVEENGVTYRVDSAGTRVRLQANESRIVVDNGVRYRVDPDGSRVRISPDGLRIGDSVIKGNAPNGRSDVETPGETLTDAGEDAVEAIGDAVPN